ncbi:uncharacterized protein PGTG_15766 [Puccinia graminis f. sp. tritici CRL 75-36-700-3]|uniref:DUF6818 domain-containing protein n=1 Tax=Puccinia graminis f. sp. tritici (strain CRL 75-36-700-3 / race SCCL) TaxID=418459 RepID=E3KZS9_PUCGT|nr:uncharacterized protein PGTG_15766 [Puccinia graminis f. sp. tritici CRL 75-36-700-3]EFP89810.2 hypothetical protein PGTG_15766 [Puccinia graminis f. sp. tritici CRL 75-36-700-3]
MINQSGKKTGGRPPGSLGYNIAECMLLVEAVKTVLPLGNQDWLSVADQYNTKVLLLNRPKQEADNLKQKFKGLAQSQKPTGNATCPEHICEAKRVNALINEKANECALGSLSSGDERNGVGADVLSSDNNDVDMNESPGTGKLESGQQEGASSARPSPITSVNPRSRGRPGNQLESRLNSFLDMDARKEQEHKQSLASFYSAQLMEANATIRDLQSELARVRGGIQSDVVQLQEEKHRLELENTSLKSKIEVLQLRAEMQPNAVWGQMHPQMFNQGFAMQSLPVFGTHYQQQPPTGLNPQLANTSGLTQQPPSQSGLNQTHSDPTGMNQPQPTSFNHQTATPTSLNQQQPSILTPNQVGFHPQQQPQGQHHFGGISDALEADPTFPHV